MIQYIFSKIKKSLVKIEKNLKTSTIYNEMKEKNYHKLAINEIKNNLKSL